MLILTIREPEDDSWAVWGNRKSGHLEKILAWQDTRHTWTSVCWPISPTKREENIPRAYRQTCMAQHPGARHDGAPEPRILRTQWHFTQHPLSWYLTKECWQVGGAWAVLGRRCSAGRVLSNRRTLSIQGSWDTGYGNQLLLEVTE